MPAIDLVNMRPSERIVQDDMTIAFIASGDLRDVIRTVNELPKDYTGELTVLLNDHNPMIVARNFALLLLLGSIENKRKAADIAVHYWYSALVPAMYNVHLQQMIQDVLSSSGASSVGANGSISCVMTPKSRIEGCLGTTTITILKQCVFSPESYQAQDVREELTRARLVNLSRDRLERQYWPLEPSHRLAFIEFRTYGLLLPFGAANSHFDYPNRLLFSPDGQWMQADKVNPLNGWHIPSLVKAGRKHGALPMDIYGCMYFYVSDQLREFASRLSSLRIRFKLFNLDACKLGNDLSSGVLSPYGLSDQIRFDRIDASNVMDPHYLGIEPVAKVWGPLLKHTNHATLVGHFINWVSRQRNANPSDADIPRLMRRLVSDNRIKMSPPSSSPRVGRELTEICAQLSCNAVHDNSKAFDDYLDSQGIDYVLSTSGLKRKRKHTIVPHRLGGSFESPSALPTFSDDKNWYLSMYIKDHLWSERYLELAPA
ncbi:uncharacterized protein FIBRA_03130 [Fibroporia radiculosa]|uniref:DUF4470 domain-containing protein n=1 Tax=Fibroporia radiculosa TaxID=599839 RepID=J4HVT7_9APHY|nr:uncharacterized protein FIBRA_03130 [Fibroporia radiculosa]CCM01082.1 predicted protein [Fibroporia radiculosa]